MGWSEWNPEIKVEDMVKLVKGFVDIVILASGYQSSGLPSIWDSHNINLAFQWALFFEDVFRRLSSSDGYQESVNELDAALKELTANPIFPQGLAHLSSAVLTKARDFVLQHLIHTLPLRDSHLKALLTAAVEMDLDELQGMDCDSLTIYLNNLTMHNTQLNPVSDWSFSANDLIPTSPKAEIENLTKLTARELLKRQCAVSHMSVVETGLDVLSEIISRNVQSQSVNTSSMKEQLNHLAGPLSEEELVGLVRWNQWKSRNLSYFLDKRTVGLVSGADMIFSSPEIQWMQVFGRLNISAETSYEDFLETIELLLLGCVASRWNCLIEHFMSVSYESVTISKQYHQLQNLLVGRSQTLYSQEEMSRKESSILEHLTTLLGNQLHELWKVSPVLLAVSLPSRSLLFKLYIRELGTQLKGLSPTYRCCSCTRDQKEHIDCELAERIWCLYIFHVRGLHLIRG